jgi:hypothetical protein
VKTALQGVGFHDNGSDKGTIYYLPETTLWHPNLSNTAEAKRVFINVIDNLNANKSVDLKIKTKHFIAIEFLSTSAIPGEPYTKNS